MPSPEFSLQMPIRNLLFSSLMGALEYEGSENETAVATIGVVTIDPSGRSCAAG